MYNVEMGKMDNLHSFGSFIELNYIFLIAAGMDAGRKKGNFMIYTYAVDTWEKERSIL
jgi:hypothetical protein